MQEQLNILIVDDHQMFIDGLKALIRNEKQLNVVGEELNGTAAYNRIKEGNVDLVITDIDMPEMNGIELTRKIKKDFPNVKVLVLSMHNDQEIVRDIMMSEAEGFILKNTGKQELMEALNRIMDNATFYSRDVLNVMMHQMKQEKVVQTVEVNLTERELEVLKLICEENSSQQIADQLFVSRRTIDTHRINILEKTSCTTIVGLIKFAIRNHLIEA